MRIFVFGNEFLSEDNMAYLVARHLAQTQEWRDSGHEFVFCRAPEELLDEASPVTILDVAKDAKEVISFNDADALLTRKLMSLHDLDLSYFLKIMKEIEPTKKLKIIAIPPTGEINKIGKGVLSCLHIKD